MYWDREYISESDDRGNESDVDNSDDDSSLTAVVRDMSAKCDELLEKINSTLAASSINNTKENDDDNDVNYWDSITSR